MKKGMLICFVGLVAIMSTTFAANAETAASVISIKTPQIKAIPKNLNSTEVFMELINIGRQPHTVIAAVSPVAEKIQLHKTITEKGETRMAQINQIKVMPHKIKDLKAGGLHIMLIGLLEKVTPGQEIPITLVFHDGSDLTVYAKVSDSYARRKATTNALA